MKRIFRYGNSDDWETNVKQTVNSGYFKVNKGIGIALNIAVPATLLFALHVDLLTFMLCFVGFDVGMMALDYASIGTYKAANGFAWLTQKKAFTKKVKDMTADEIKAMKEEIGSCSSFYKEKLEILNSQLEEYRRLDSITTPQEHRDTVKYVEEMIEKMRSYVKADSVDEGGTAIPWIQKKLKKTVEESDKLFEVVNNDPDSIVQIINTYNVYAEEMMKIIVKYQESDKEQQEKMAPKLQNLIDTFNNKLQRLEERITSAKERSLDMDIDYLTKRLNEDVTE